MKGLWNKWKIFAERVGNFQANLIFSFLYFLLITPLGIVSNLFGDFLRKRSEPRWQKTGVKANSLKEMREQ